MFSQLKVAFKEGVKEAERKVRRELGEFLPAPWIFEGPRTVLRAGRVFMGNEIIDIKEDFPQTSAPSRLEITFRALFPSGDDTF